MSPILGLTEQIRMPRIGKLHLGIKVKNKAGVEYPKATDYFVCPPEVIKVFGEKPTSLPMFIPVEDEEYWASQYYRAYSQTRGLICRGDGVKSRRMIDTKTGNIAENDSKGIAWAEGTCEGHECSLYKEKKCSETMCLQFMLPDVPGVGVWQIDTGSINSIRNINSEAALIRSLCGRIKMLPLLLVLEEQEVVNPDDGKKKKVHVLHLRQKESLQALLADSKKSVFELLAPPVDEEQAARDIDAYWEEDPQKSKPAPEAKLSPVDSLSGLPDELKDKKKPIKEETGSKPLPTFKTASELFNYALKQGISLETIREKTGASNPTEIVDLKEASIKLLDLSS